MSEAHPVGIRVEPHRMERNRLTVAFRFILGIPHMILVGGPLALVLTHRTIGPNGDTRIEWAGAGLLGAVAAMCAVIAWFAILFAGVYPAGLRDLVLFFMRWRVRVMAYLALLRDEYPPFGEGSYPASLVIEPAVGERDKLSVFLRPLLAIPHLFMLWVLGIAWVLTTIVAWFSILFTGTYPQGLYDFAVGVIQWNVRVEVYLLLLHDDYPPFSLDISATR